MRNITVVGVGYVGLVTGACFADLGNQVCCLDVDEAKIKILKEGGLPIYEPEREKVIFDNVRQANRGPLPDKELVHIFERIIDVMRSIQRDEIAPRAKATAGGDTEFEAEVND